MAGEQLRVTDGNEPGRRLSVDGDLLIGRAAPDAEGRLGDDSEISRRHAHISRGADGRLTIEDLGSANGTFVNDRRIEGATVLDTGDVIRVGRTVLEVTPGSEAVPEKPEAREELLVTEGTAQGRLLRLADELVIGRAADGEGRLSDDLELSRRHARIARDASGRLTIEDLESANGTFVNGRRVHGRQVLEIGDSIRVGSTTLQLTDSRRASPSSPAPARAQATPPVADLEEVAAELAPGSSFAGCRVETIVGHGDMGVVYRAEDLALQRRLALKLIRPEYSGDERFRERFRRESTIAAAIDHPNVIPIFDAGEEEGVLFITMRLVEGSDLRAVIAREGRVEPLRAARIVRQVGAALDAAHARGMLHRDVKPSNVLLGREDHVYLTDFGLAKPAAATGGLTRHGTVVARAQYVAPEQMSDQRVDARADIYALGCLLFEALTGEPPSGTWKDDPARFDALPREFEDVVRRAMAKDPGDRFPSAGDLGEAALVAAGGLRRARPWSVVATGEAAFSPDEPTAPGASEPEAVEAAEGRGDALQWAIAIAGLVIVAIGMIAALHGISTL